MDTNEERMAVAHRYTDVHHVLKRRHLGLDRVDRTVGDLGVPADERRHFVEGILGLVEPVTSIRIERREQSMSANESRADTQPC